MARRFDTANMTAQEREDLLIKIVPGDVITVPPGTDTGCPCAKCKEAWGEGKYANGGRQRGGWCPELRQLVGVKAGYVSRYCPSVPEGGEVHDPKTVILRPITIIPAGTPVKGASEGIAVHRRTSPGTGTTPVASSRRERPVPATEGA